ncbi:MAG: Hsp20/alpha crystallin family protein [Gammaproteobacteria bacterium]|nr:Hsp20/alpha crystallin family protein [Gammaproteobacteria bacterium]
MNLMRYEPLHREIDRIFRGFGENCSTNWVPAVDIREDEDRFVLHLDVPGVDPAQIDIAVEDAVLSLSGTRESDQAQEHDGYRRVERVSGKFLRRFTLPDGVDPEAVTARSNNGVLEVSIPKAPQAKPKRIEVTVN